MEKMTNSNIDPNFDWTKIARYILISRELDEIEETTLTPKGIVLYQFSARGHDLSQVLLGSLLTNKVDAASAYYRSRPLLLTLGLGIEDAFAGPMAKSGGISDGRDIGVVFNFPNKDGAIVIPMAGDVGSQFTPAAGYAQAILYRYNVLKEKEYQDAISVVLAGEGAVATNGFWSSLTMATTLKLPLLFYIEDNEYAISVKADKQTPGSNIAQNLASFNNLHILDGDGCNPGEAASKLSDAVSYVRQHKGPALIRLTVPRLSGHSGQDTQAYKTDEFVKEEQEQDPLKKLVQYLVPTYFTETEFSKFRCDIQDEVNHALTAALNRPEPDKKKVAKYVFAENNDDETPDLQMKGGLAAERYTFPESTDLPNPEPTRINMVTAIRRTLESELETNPKLLVFGEDVGVKGGVHAVTMGLHEKFGEERVFDTSLSEEGIIGRSVGMAIAGLMPVAEIQFRKYADPATEQLNNCGTIRWRTANRFAAPIVVRLPGGFFKCGDPWHSVCGEVIWAHGHGWQVFYPSNAEDAVGLLRTAMRSNNPTIFFEHRHMLDTPWARRPYPGDHFALPAGKAKIIQDGNQISLITWGAMVERCELAVKLAGYSVEILDLRTIMPWDKNAVLNSIKKTRRCLIVHEDNSTAGFGAEIAAVVASKLFLDLDAPVERLTTPDVPIPYNVGLMNAILPNVDTIAGKIGEMINF